MTREPNEQETVGTTRDDRSIAAQRPSAPQPDRAMEQQTLLVHSGPLPAPWVLEGYEGVQDSTVRRRGQFFAFVVVLVGLAGGIYLLDNDKSLWAGAVAISPLALRFALLVAGSAQSRAKAAARGRISFQESLIDRR